MWVARICLKLNLLVVQVQYGSIKFVLNKYKEGIIMTFKMKFMTLCTESMVDLGDKKTRKKEV